MEPRADAAPPNLCRMCGEREAIPLPELGPVLSRLRPLFCTLLHAAMYGFICATERDQKQDEHTDS